jgi:hypothetical protein
MSTKRIRDPLGLLPDAVGVHLDDDPSDFDTIAELLKSKAPAARIERLRRHDELRAATDMLAGSHEAAKTDAARMLVQIHIEDAEKRAQQLDVIGRLVRDKARQDGTKKERRPEINVWIAEQLRLDPEVKSPALWTRAPEWLTDMISYDRFQKRVTGERKKSRK